MERLERIRKEMEETRDSLGKPIDNRIKELVIGLRCWGITTKSSCEGHQDRGSQHPWIGIPFKCLKGVAKAIHYHSLSEGYKIGWTIERIGTIKEGSLRLVPQNKEFPLKVLQEGAEVFGSFLQQNSHKDLNMS